MVKFLGAHFSLGEQFLPIFVSIINFLPIVTVGFNSYQSCLKCTTIEEFDKRGRQMSFPRIDCPLRDQTGKDHHKDDSPLLKLKLDMVQDIIIADSLHLYDLGNISLFLKLHS